MTMTISEINKTTPILVSMTQSQILLSITDTEHLITAINSFIEDSIRSISKITLNTEAILRDNVEVEQESQAVKTFLTPYFQDVQVILSHIKQYEEQFTNVNGHEFDLLGDNSEFLSEFSGINSLNDILGAINYAESASKISGRMADKITQNESWVSSRSRIESIIFEALKLKAKILRDARDIKLSLDGNKAMLSNANQIINKLSLIGVSIFDFTKMTDIEKEVLINS